MRRARRAGLGALAAAGLLVAGCAGGGGDDAGRPTGPTGPGPVSGEVAERAAGLLGANGADDPGCAVTVRRGDDVVWTDAAGLADVELGEPIDDETVFDIGSTSKIFTATLVLDLVATGELALDDTVADHLAGLPAWAERVTVEQLLHHTSGIPDYISLLYDEGYVDADRTTVQDAFDALSGVALEREPGRRFAYTNSGYLLLAEMAGAATGQDPAAAIAERVFARYDLDAELDPVTDDPRRATSYVRAGGGWRDADSAWEQVGDGAVQTTPVELVR